MLRFGSVGLVAVLVFSMAVLASPATAADWPQFRGPFFNGSTDETNLPSKWSVEDGENIKWTAKLPGPSAATPIVYGDHVFLASTDADKDSLVALAIDRKTGKQLWTREIARGTYRDRRSNFASSSPATDGERVVFFYGTGEMVAYDFAGKELWQRDITEDYGEFAFLWTFSTSPLLFDGRLYMQVLQRDTPVDGRGFSDRKNESYLLAMDPKTGKTLWRHVRPSKARYESLEAFTTPTPFTIGGKSQLLIIGGDALTGHDPATGKELFRWGTWNPTRIHHWRHVPSPVGGDGVVLVCAPKRAPVYAISVGGKGRLGDDAVAWVTSGNREVASDVPTPAYADGDFFVLKEERPPALTRVEPKTGDVKWKMHAPGRAKYEASPTVADGKVYVVNFSGEVAVVDAKKGKLIGVYPTNPTREYPIRSSVVAARGNLFVRVNRRLICIGK